MDTVDQDTAALEQLVFAADTAFKKVIEPAPPNADALHEAELALTQLQMMLTYLGSRSEHEGWHSQPLMEDCLSRLQRIRLQASTTESRRAVLVEVLAKAHLYPTFRIPCPPSTNLVARMRDSEPFSKLLALPRPSRQLPLPAPRHPVLTERNHSSPPGHPPQQHHHQRQQHQEQQNHQQLASNSARAAFPHPPPGPALPPAPATAGNCGRWATKVPRGGHDATVHDSHRRRRPSGSEDEDQEQEGVNGGEYDADGPNDSPPKNNHFAFQTAKAKYVSDLRKNGGREPSFGGGNSAGGGGGGHRAPPLRSNAAGLRKTPNVDVSGPGGKFVPPFVKKALQAQAGGGSGGGGCGAAGGEESDGPLSLRTMELLRLTPGEPLPEGLSRLDPAMIEQVCNEVIDSGGRVTWEDIAGQEPAKKLIQEVVVWPMLNPSIFTGARAPPKGILLFGPPGTGKTLLGKAIASNINAAFFSISASSLTSKWIGEGEKMVRTLFAVAGWLAPAVIFVDEIDSLLSARKADGEHEASRRLKTEMLVQMEGCDPSSADRRVLLIGATNRPEELDEAARRRMPKQLYIPLPCAEARRQMVLRQLGPGGGVSAALSDADYEKIVAKTEGYSGSDMKNLIQEACQGPVRDAVRAAGAGVAQLQAADLRPVVLKDFAVGAKAQRASVEPAEVVRYEKYNEKHGAKLVTEEGEGVGGGEGDEDDDW